MSTDDFSNLIKSRFRTLQQTVPLEGDLGHCLVTQRADGSWPDIAYAGPLDWTSWCHVDRLANLSRAYTREGHRLAGDQAVLRVILGGTDYWLQHRHQASNWWYNYIGVPREVCVIAVLLDKHLGPERLSGALSVLDQAGTPADSASDDVWLPYNDQPPLYKEMKTGANLVWLAYNAFFRSLLRNDAGQMTKCANLVWGEAKVGDTNGIQPDGVFYQHGPRVQNFHYGLSFLENVFEFAWLLRKTPLAMPGDRRRIISHCLLEGARWMCRGVTTVPGTLDRAATRVDALRVKKLSRLLDIWKEVAPDVADEVTAFLAAQSDGTAAVHGFRHFPSGDFSAYHRPRFSIFLKTVSTRTELTESLNGENLRGVPYLNCGDHYVLQHGDEYHNMPPVWAWPKLPGLTMSSQPSVPVRTPAVGGVSNGRSGLTVMHYARQETAPPTEWSLRKFWAFHNDTVVCLLGGWQAPSGSSDLTTSLEQCRRRGPALVATPDGVQELAGGEHRLNNVKWVLHRQVGYLPISPASLRIKLSEVTGTWKQINAGFAEASPVTEQLFLLEMCHPQPATAAGFVLIGSVDADKLNAYAKDPPWTVLANDKTQQSLRFIDGTTMAACYTSGVVTEGAEELLRVDRPCLALWTADDLWLSDHLRTGGQVRVTWHGEKHMAELPSGGQSVRFSRS